MYIHKLYSASRIRVKKYTLLVIFKDNDGKPITLPTRASNDRTSILDHFVLVALRLEAFAAKMQKKYTNGKHALFEIPLKIKKFARSRK